MEPQAAVPCTVVLLEGDRKGLEDVSAQRISLPEEAKPGHAALEQDSHPQGLTLTLVFLFLSSKDCVQQCVNF